MNPDQNTNPTPSQDTNQPVNPPTAPQPASPAPPQPIAPVQPQAAPTPNVTPPQPVFAQQPAPQVFSPTAPVAGAPSTNPVVSPTAPVSAATPTATQPEAAAPATSPSQTAAAPGPQSPSPVSGGVFAGAPVNPANVPPNPRSKQKKKLIVIGAVAATVVMLGGVGAYFGLYVPNQPDNVYSTGLNRTGKVVGQLVNEGLEENKLKAYENTELSGSLEISAQGQTYKGTIGSKFDPKRSDSTLTYDGEGSQDVNVQVLTDLKDGKTYPDTFFKVTGINAVGLDGLMPGIGAYEDKWISASSDYLQSLVPSDAANAQNENKFTQQDAAELGKIVTEKTREYVFTTKPDKAITVQKKFVGTEKLDDVTANHYEVGLNKENAKKFCRAITEAVMSSNAYKNIPGVSVDNIDEDKKKAVEDCDQSVDKDIKESDTVDMWVDKKLKLIHKIRVTDENDKDTYVEFGQNYKKGDVIPMFVRYVNKADSTNIEITLEANTKASTTKGTIKLESGEGADSRVTANGTFEFKPHNGEVKIDAPTNTVPLQDVLQAFGVDPSQQLSADEAAVEDEADFL